MANSFIETLKSLISDSAYASSNSDSVCGVGCHIAAVTEDERREQLHPACAAPPFYDHGGQKYCVLHLPSKTKDLTAFTEAVETRLKDENKNNRCNFRGVWFPDPQRFEDVVFDSKADFTYATFSGDVNFRGVTFSKGAEFKYTRFAGEASFYKAIASKPASFLQATFDKRVVFNLANFNEGAVFCDTLFHGEAIFSNAVFKEYALFAGSTFKDQVTFYGDEAFKKDGDTNKQPYVSFHLSRVSDPANFAIRGGRLRPSWFINVDNLRMFSFSDVRWCGILGEPDGGIDKDVEVIATALDKVKQLSNEEHGAARQLLEAIEPNIARILTAHKALAAASRELAINAEENHRYEEAADFRYFSAEAQRRQEWRTVKQN